MPASTAAATLTATYGDLEEVKKLFEANKGEVRACTEAYKHCPRKCYATL